MTETPDFRESAGATNERIVIRNASILVYADDFAVVIIQSLCVITTAKTLA
jgi:hypothetical protein